MSLDLSATKRHAKQYVEQQAKTRVTSIKFVKRLRLFGREDVLLSVTTTDDDEPDWWVIGGATPMNLYSKQHFPEPDVAYSLHQGLMLRLADRDFGEARDAPERIGYDAFISHASEDKAKVVKPLALRLEKMGYAIWYDEFELKVGDSLRQSIDRGLVNSPRALSFQTWR